MMPVDRRFALLWLAAVAIVGAAFAALAAGIHAAVDDVQRAQARALVDAAAPLPHLIALGLVIVLGALAAWICRAYFDPLRRAEQAVSIVSAANPGHRLDAEGPIELQRLLGAVNGLADRLHAATVDTEARIAQAQAALELERNRLAVLMAELPQSVIVCDAQARIMLYNEQARRLFAPGGSRRANVVPAYIGLGRSLYGLLPRNTVEGALRRLARRSADGELDAIEVLSTPLPGGGLARIRVSPMAAAKAPDATDAGFVLLLEDVTAETTGVEQRRVVLTELLTQTSAALAVLHPALDRLEPLTDGEKPALEAAAGAVQRLAAATLAARTALTALDLSTDASADVVLAEDLAVMVADALRRTGTSTNPEPAPSPSVHAVRTRDLLQTMRYLAHRLREAFGIRDLTLRVEDVDGRLVLALGWLGHRLSAATLAAWEDDPLSLGGEASPITLRELLQRQRAELSHEIDRISGRARLRLSLPLAQDDAPSRAPARADRPIFYDFDLPAPARGDALAAELPLAALTLTAFDTETTGLDPVGGDEIISIGAIRIVNGRMIEGETFDQLIDTTRRIHPDAMKVHGIRPELLQGQPSLDRVLPQFHAFCDGTVLLGHNVAFDLRFLQLKEDVLGVRFRQPVLDTLLLAEVLHDRLEDNRLEAIAHRLGIEVVGRHTALGDARVTAAVFLKMVPLLAARGIATLGQAQAASEKTRYARLAY